MPSPHRQEQAVLSPSVELDVLASIFGEFIENIHGADAWRQVQLMAMPSSAQGLQNVEVHSFAPPAMQVTKSSMHDLCYAFGRYFVKAAVDRGFAKIFSGVGSTILIFLASLNMLFLNLKVSMDLPNYITPEFRVEKVTKNSLELHYRSKRPIGSWVEGMCVEVSERFFKIPTKFKLLRGQADGTCDHEVWLVTIPTIHVAVKRVVSARTLMASRYRPEAALFHSIFPFHLVLNEKLRVVQVGSGFSRMVPELIPGAAIADHLNMIVPYTGWDFKVTQANRNGCFVIETKAGASFKGGVYQTKMPDGTSAILFVGSPRVDTLDGLVALDMRIADIPPHDMTADFVVLSERRMVEAELTRRLEVEKIKLQKITEALEKQQLESDIANQRLKESLAEALAARGGNEAPSFESKSPAEATVKILESVLHGDQVDLKEVITLRDAIIASGKDIHRPMNLIKRMKSVNRDKDVNKALMTLLSVDDDEDDVDLEDALSDYDLNAGITPDVPQGPQGTRRPPRHRSSILMAQTLPDNVLSILKGPNDPVLQVLSKIDEWQFDSFKLNDVTSGHPLSTLAFAIMTKCDLVPGRHSLSQVRLARFLCKIEEGYSDDNDYHNRVHAADVLRTLYCILTQGGVLKTVWQDSTDLGLLMTFLSAIIHDYEHRGVNNDYLIKSQDDLALLYNDRSPMENHHLAAAFSLMKDDSMDFLKGLQPKLRTNMRKHIIEMVLATDMKQVSLFKTKFAARDGASSSGGESPRGSLQSSLGVSGQGSRSGQMDDDMRSLALQMALKCADLGHLTASREVHRKWVTCLEAEFFKQGDREREALLPISPLMDRTKEGVAKSQPGFLTIVVMPQYQAFCTAFPGCFELLRSIKDNYTMWVEESKVK